MDGVAGSLCGVGDRMQKLILGLSLSSLGGAGFVYAMREILTAFSDTSEIGWGNACEQSLNFAVIVVLLGIIFFVAGLAFILTDDDLRTL